ncbi:C-type lectin domain family 6 member A-like [Rhynchonycteris naso]
MVQESQRQSREKAIRWFQVKLWFVAVISIALLCACFIVSCIVTYHFTYGKTDRKLSELRSYHLSLTCFNEGTRVTGKNWGCCPSTWKAFGSSCYFISTEENIWSDSEEICVSMGAHLVVINSKAEQNFIVQELNQSVSYFLGLSDPQKNDKWQWIDQTSYTANVKLWHRNEPNFKTEKCASIVFWDGVWGWNNVHCDSKRYSICELKKIYL